MKRIKERFPKLKNIGLIALAGLLIFVMTAVGLPFGVSENTVYAADEKTWPHEPEVTYITRKTIEFGTYPQYDKDEDGDIDWDDATPITWQILDDSDPTNVLIMSDKILDCKKYNEDFDEITWETCSLRAWLNSTGMTEYEGFYNTAFSGTEKSYINSVTISNDDNYALPNYTASGGNDTEDNIFLLSLDEMKNTSYKFDGDFECCDQTRAARVTNYATANGVDTEADGTGYYWLRSTVGDRYLASYIYTDGSCKLTGNDVNTTNYGVRPALRINLQDADLKQGEINVNIESVDYDTISIGKDNGNDIEWNVLKIDGVKALVFATDNLYENRMYNASLTGTTTWANSDIRAWLNSDNDGFYMSAFTPKEKESILQTTVENNIGGNTDDYVFLLSVEELTNTDYGFSSMIRCYSVCRVATGGSYWTRSLQNSNNTSSASKVKPKGAITYGLNTNHTNNYNGIRPAMWVDLEKLGYPVPVSDVTIDNTYRFLTVGKSFKLTATVSPDNAADKVVSWASNNTDVATVDENGSVTAVGKGTAVITVTTHDGDKKAAYTVNVYEGNRDRSTDMSWPENPRLGYITRKTIEFGTYPQYDKDEDGDIDWDDATPITWQILDDPSDPNYDPTSVLVLADNILDCRKYYDDYDSVTWEKSSIRAWLNSTGMSNDEGFYNTAFSNTEKSYINSVTISTSDNTIGPYPASGGNDTEDNIFLLSLDEMKNALYKFDEDIALYDQTKAAIATDYAAANGVDTGVDGTGAYWLRSPGLVSNDASFVSCEGKRDSSGIKVDTTTLGVRPAMRINLQEADSGLDLKQGETNVNIEYVDYDTITIGKDNGNDIVWNVLKVEGNKALIYASDTLSLKKAYQNPESDNTTWKNSQIRAWLNSDADGFYKTAFTDDDRRAILQTRVENNIGDDTDDYVFLLSIEELTNTDYGFNSMMKCYSISRTATKMYWTRSLDKDSAKNAGLVHVAGYIVFYSNVNTSNERSLRPAMWVDLAKLGYIKPVDSVELNKTSLDMKMGEEETLTATVLPDYAADKSVTWSSNKEDVATVSSEGLVTAVGEGNATITVKTVDGEKTATCEVTVSKIVVEKVELNKTKENLLVDGTLQLIATVTPDEATNKDISWKSNDETVATVSKDGLVKAKAAGTAIITATNEDSGKSASCEITVTEPAPKQEEYKMDTSSAGNGTPTWQSGSDEYLIITIKTAEGEDDSFDHFQNLELDGKLLKRNVDYTVERGSTIIKIKASVLEALEPGGHTLAVIFDNGRYETKFNILPKEEKKTDDNKTVEPVSNDTPVSTVAATPDTGDSGYMPWLMTLLISAGTATVIVTRVKRTKDEK